MADHVYRGIAADGQVLAFSCDTTEMVEEARKRHGLSKVATAALGRTMSAAAMMAVEAKTDEETFSINIEGNGPIRKVIAIADGAGRVRGTVGDPTVELPLNAKGKLDVAGALGIGVMSIVKDLGLKEPYVGSTHLVTSEIAEDLAYYYTVSEQRPSAVALGVLVHDDGTVWKSGGFVLQMLPGASDEVAEELQNRVTNFPQLTTFLAEGHTAEEVLNELLKDMDYKTLAGKEMHFECDCNERKVEAAFISVGRSEIESMIAEGQPVEMTCHFCNQKYYISVDRMKELLTEATKP